MASQTRSFARPASDDGLDEIETILHRAREGSLAEDVAFEAISRVVRRHAPAAETYQKPWG